MDDYIERESVMAILEDHPAGSWRGHDVYTDEIRAVMKEVGELPAADVAPVRWTSVDERLPHAEYGESDSVLVVTELGSMQVLYFDGGNWCHPTGEPFIRAKFRVTHWMPLPEPPEDRTTK